MRAKRSDDDPAAVRASTWIAELVLVSALVAGGTKLSAGFARPAAAPAEITVAVASPPPPIDRWTNVPDSFVHSPGAPPTAEAPRIEAGTNVSDSFVQPAAMPSPYRREWRTAAARAAQRDLDGAVAILRRAARESDDARREAAEDLADLQRLRAFEERAAARMARFPRGSQVELEVRGRGTLAGTVLQADRERVELRTSGGPIFVEFVDLAWSTLAGWGDEDARALDLALLLDGRRVDEKHGGLPAPDAPTPPDRLELDARSLLYEAERAFRKPASRTAAVAKYRLLLSDYPGASVVRRSMPRITARSTSPEDLYFGAADLRGSGAFRLHPDAWRAEGAIDFSQARFSFVEAEFEAEAGVPHRLFLRLGGCCEERFLAYAQASGLEKTHPSRGVKVAVEPGSVYAQILRRPPPELPKAHVDGHPLLWSWVELPLAAFATAGPKRVRVLAAREGVAVSGILLSTTRAAAPTEDERAAFEAARDVE